MSAVKTWVVVFGAVAALAASARAADAPPAATGRIYIARSRDPHIGFPAFVTINGKLLASNLAPGACVHIDLPPGAYALHAMSENDLSVDLAAGGTRYVTLETRRTELGSVESDQIVPELAEDVGDTARCGSVAAPP